MVSKASEDLPDPDNPVITVNRSRGMSTLMFLRLCWRAPLTLMRSMAIVKISHSSRGIFARQATHGTEYDGGQPVKQVRANSLARVERGAASETQGNSENKIFEPAKPGGSVR